MDKVTALEAELAVYKERERKLLEAMTHFGCPVCRADREKSKTCKWCNYTRRAVPWYMISIVGKNPEEVV